MTQRLSVVFVHGLRSSSETWGSFIRLLEADPDLAGVRLLRFDYATDLFSIHPLRRIPTFDDVADSLRTYLDHHVSAGPVVVVAHSQGGLITQRYLARALAKGQAADLARIRRIVLFACPNLGSELGLFLRKALLSRRSTQERELRPLVETVADTHRIVLEQIDRATELTSSHCPIGITAYAGETDGVVTRVSAHGAFRNTGVLPGDHNSIIAPDSHQHLSYLALKRHLLAASQERPPSPAATPTPPDPVAVPPPAPTPVAARPRPPRQKDQRNADGRIVEQLLAISGMADPTFRQQLVNQLPAAIRASLPRYDTPRRDVTALVGHLHDCADELRPWAGLASALRTLAPEQRAVRELVALLAELELVTTEEGPEVPRPG